MRGKLIRLIGATALTSTIVTLGCADYGSSSSSSSAGGTTSTATGGTSSTGTTAKATGGSANGGAATGGASAASACTAIQPCGGSLVGTWNVSSTSTCLSLSGTMDLSSIGADCKSGTVNDGTVQITGSITFTDTGFTDSTTTTITEHLTLPTTCLAISGTHTDCPGLNPIAQTLGFTKMDCSVKTGGAGECACTATLSAGTQVGGLGFVDVNALDSGTYTTSGSTFTTTDGRQKFDYQYCVSGSTLTLLPVSKLQTVSGMVTLTKG